jgi:hypothetical protein
MRRVEKRAVFQRYGECRLRRTQQPEEELVGIGGNQDCCGAH